MRNFGFVFWIILVTSLGYAELFSTRYEEVISEGLFDMPNSYHLRNLERAFNDSEDLLERIEDICSEKPDGVFLWTFYDVGIAPKYYWISAGGPAGELVEGLEEVQLPPLEFERVYRAAKSICERQTRIVHPSLDSPRTVVFGVFSESKLEFGLIVDGNSHLRKVFDEDRDPLRGELRQSLLDFLDIGIVMQISTDLFPDFLRTTYLDDTVRLLKSSEEAVLEYLQEASGDENIFLFLLKKLEPGALQDGVIPHL